MSTILDDIKPVTIKSKKMIVTLPREDYDWYFDNIKIAMNGERLRDTIANKLFGAAQLSYESEREIKQIRRRAKRRKRLDEEDEKRIQWLERYLLPNWTIEKREIVIDPTAKDDFTNVTNKTVFEAQAQNRNPLPLNWEDIINRGK
jgi:hypothetical protein